MFDIAAAARLGDDVTLTPGSVVTRTVLTTLAEALSSAAAWLLEIEPGDISGEHRVALTPAGRSGREYEVYLYDLAPGGASFSCSPLPPATASCWSVHSRSSRCTCTLLLPSSTSYQNRFLHGELDRWLAADLLRYCETARFPNSNPLARTRCWPSWRRICATRATPSSSWTARSDCQT